MKEFWKTGLAIVGLAGLGAYIWFVERHREVGPDEPKEKILSVDRAHAAALTIEATSKEAVRLVKEGESWRVAAPFEAPADSSAVDSMLGNLEDLEAEEVVVETAEDVAQYGLESPARTVSVVVEGQDEPLVVHFGDKSPGGSAVYARTPSSPRVFTVATWIESSFDKKPFDLRDRSLLHVKRDDVARLEVEGPEGDYTLARNEAGQWAFTKPLETRAGRWSVDGLLGTLENLRMDEVAAEEAESLKGFGLDRPSWVVTLGLEDGSSRTLEVGDPAGDDEEGKYHARERGSKLVAVIPGTIVSDLEKGMGELRAKRLLEIATYDTEGFDVVSGGASRTYAKSSVEDEDGLDQTQWKRTAPEAEDLETTTVEDALFKLGGVEVQEFLDEPGEPAAYGLDAPEIRVTVRAKTESWVEIGRKDGELFARRSADEAVLKLDSSKAEELLEAFEAL